MLVDVCLVVIVLQTTEGAVLGFRGRREEDEALGSKVISTYSLCTFRSSRKAVCIDDCREKNQVKNQSKGKKAAK